MSAEEETLEAPATQGATKIEEIPDNPGKPDDAAAGTSEGIAGIIDKDFLSGMIAIGVALVIIIVSIVSTLMTQTEGDAGEGPASSEAEVPAELPGSTGSSGGSSISDASRSPASAAITSRYESAKYRDSHHNPSVYALLELTGTELRDLLVQCGFQWDSSISFWVAPGGSLFGVKDASGSLSQSQISALPAGGLGQSVFLCLSVVGYDTPDEAFSKLSVGVSVDDVYSVDDALFAVVHGSSSDGHLLMVTTTDESEQTFLVFTGDAVSSGLLESVIGMDAGSSLDEVWRVITGGYHIGEYSSDGTAANRSGQMDALQ